jgi:hypothetical protein
MNLQPSRVQSIVEWGLKISLLLLSFAAPISIAATQTAWALVILFWLIRLIYVRPSLVPDRIGIAIIAFFFLSLVSSVFSYEPNVSLRKMVSVSLVSIVFFVATTVKDRRLLAGMVSLLIAGCVASCIFTFATQAIGKNLKILNLAPESPLRTAGLLENDTILTAGVRKIERPEDLVAALTEPADDPVPILFYRKELLIKVYLNASPNFDPGIVDWTRGRDTRAAGFYGHYTTFAEALQLIGSLTLGLLLMVPGGVLAKRRIVLGFALAAISLALFLTVTRASWAGFAISVAVILLLSASRRALLVLTLMAVPVAVAGLLYIQYVRNVSFIDANDDSTAWRLTVWREAVGVLTSELRHLVAGVGMDSLKTHWQDWQMFDNGKRPIGHLHSTPLQLAFERGIPALIAWLAWMLIFLKRLYDGLRDDGRDWLERGILLGTSGGTIGFLAAGLVHYNWGDSEVVMIFYLMMGLSLAVLIRNRPGETIPA